MTITKADTGITLRAGGMNACAVAITGVSNAFDAEPDRDSPSTVTIDPAAVTLTAGDCQLFTLTGEDAYGNAFDATDDADTTFSADGGGSLTDNEFCAETAGEWTVTGSYRGRQDTAQVTIEAAAYAVYLPLVLRRYPTIPDIPTLFAIENGDEDGSYTVRWSASERATSYVLQEAAKAMAPTEGDFSAVYAGASTYRAISGQGAARYHYRVKARNSWGESNWSSVEWVDVLWEAEPNDDALTQANGPIVSGLTYYGVFPSGADEKDYYYFELPTARGVELRLTNIPSGHDYDLVLRDPANMDDPVGYSGESGNADEHIVTGVLHAGRYYVQVYNRSGSASSEPYHLKVTYTADASGVEEAEPRWSLEVTPSATKSASRY
jgi:hypothetical protein